MKFKPLLVILPLLLFVLPGCDQTVKPHVEITPVAFHNDDECHVCGMGITRFPGAKGQAISGQGKQVKKFCSVAEMLSWWMQPENQTQDLYLYVHDMAKSPWDTPDDHYLIDATQAYFVLAPKLKGAMGISLASFSDQSSAEKFAQAQQSKVMNFAQVQTLLGSSHQHQAHHHHEN